MTPGSIIDALGGTGKVAAALSLADNTVSGWRTRPGGIPSPHWASLVRMAKETNVDLSLDILADLAAREPAETRA